ALRTFEEWRGLVAAEIQQAHSRDLIDESFEDRFQEVKVLTPQRPGPRFQKPELGSQQAHPFGTLVTRFDDFGDARGVAQHDDAVAVPGFSGQKTLLAGSRARPVA